MLGAAITGSCERTLRGRRRQAVLGDSNASHASPSVADDGGSHYKYHDVRDVVVSSHGRVITEYFLNQCNVSAR